MNRLKVIDKLNFNEFKEDFRASLIAPSNTGKTEYLLYLISKIIKWYPYVFLLMPCPNDKYANYIWPNHLFIVENVQQVNEVLDVIIKFGSKLTKIGKKKKILVITDDLGLMTSNPACKIDTLLLRGRGIGISVIILAQSYQMISPNMRNNITHTFIFSVTDDFLHYVKNIPKTETVGEIMTRIKNLVQKLNNMCEDEDAIEGRKTRYVTVLSPKAGGSMEIRYSFIENYRQLYRRNVLNKQLSRMKLDSSLCDGDKRLLA